MITEEEIFQNNTVLLGALLQNLFSPIVIDNVDGITLFLIQTDQHGLG